MQWWEGVEGDAHTHTQGGPIGGAEAWTAPSLFPPQRNRAMGSDSKDTDRLPYISNDHRRGLSFQLPLLHLRIAFLSKCRWSHSRRALLLDRADEADDRLPDAFAFALLRMLPFVLALACGHATDVVGPLLK